MVREPLEDGPEHGAPGGSAKESAATEAVAVPPSQPCARLSAEEADGPDAGHQNSGQAAQAAERPLEPSVPGPAAAEGASAARLDGDRGAASAAGSAAPGAVDTTLREPGSADHDSRAKAAAGGAILDTEDGNTPQPAHLERASPCDMQDQHGASEAGGPPDARASASNRQADREWTIRHVRLAVCGIARTSDTRCRRAGVPTTVHPPTHPRCMCH